MRGRFGCKSSGVLHHVSGSQYPAADRVVRRITMRGRAILGFGADRLAQADGLHPEALAAGSRPRGGSDAGCGSVEPAVQLDFAYGTESRGRRGESRLRNPRGDTVR